MHKHVILIASIIIFAVACIGREVSNFDHVEEKTPTLPTDDGDEIEAAIKSMYTNDYRQIYRSRDASRHLTKVT